MTRAKNDIWIPFYTADYLKDTTRLNTLAHGAYLLLLIDYWTSGAPLPDNDDDLAAITRMPVKDWLKLRPTLARLPFFTVADGLWHQKRADEEIAKRTGISQGRSGAGKTGAEKRWGNRRQKVGNGIANATGQPLANAQQTDAQSQSQLQDERTSLSSRRVPDIDPAEKQRRFDQLRAAINVDPQDTTWGAIHAWLDVWRLRGADFDADVLATVVQVMSRKAKTFTPRSLNFFDEAVQQNFDARIRRAEAPAPESTLPPAPFDPEIAKWEARLHGYRENDTWDPRWGSEPGQPGCQVPAHLLIQPVAEKGAA